MPSAERIRSTTGFSEPEQLTQHKPKRLIEGFVCNPSLSHIFVSLYEVVIAIDLVVCVISQVSLEDTASVGYDGNSHKR
jgi:hypothetical protein